MVKKGDEKEEKEAVKAQILRLLEEMYDMKEEDFLSAELEVVPAGKAREAGLDRSMIMAYGQDDKVCAYAAIHALLHAKKLARTSVVMLTDKEEIGSCGATGMTSHFMKCTGRNHESDRRIFFTQIQTRHGCLQSVIRRCQQRI